MQKQNSVAVLAATYKHQLRHKKMPRTRMFPTERRPGVGRRLLLFIFLLLQCCSRGTRAWGKQGHEIIGNLAWALLSAPTKNQITIILNQTESDSNYCAEYCSPLAAVADWADRARYSAAYAWTAPLHYVDVRDDTIPGGCPAGRFNVQVSRDCSFVYPRDCVNDFCVAGAIVNYTSHLRILDESTSFTQMGAKNLSEESLMFLVHFVGDCHQPLHVARNTDRGGNWIRVKFLNRTTTLNPPRDRDVHAAERRRLRFGHHALNLHAVWDDSIIETTLAENYNNSRNAMELSLLNLIWQTQRTNSSKWNNEWLRCADGGRVACTTAWGEESWTYAVHYAYRNVDGTEIVNDTALTKDYYYTRLPIVREQLAVAAVRLASTLELTFGGHSAIFRDGIQALDY